jgi:hypothetical protein
LKWHRSLKVVDKSLWIWFIVISHSDPPLEESLCFGSCCRILGLGCHAHILSISFFLIHKRYNRSVRLGYPCMLDKGENHLEQNLY